MTNRANLHSSVASSSSSAISVTSSIPTLLDQQQVYAAARSQLTNLSRETINSFEASSLASALTSASAPLTSGSASTETNKISTGPSQKEPEKMNALINSLNDDDRMLKELEMQELTLLQRRKKVPASFTSVTSSSASSISTSSSSTSVVTTIVPPATATSAAATVSSTYSTFTPGSIINTTGEGVKSGPMDSFNPQNLSTDAISLTNVTTSNYTKQPPSSVTQFTPISFTNVTDAAFNLSSSSIYTGPSTLNEQQLTSTAAETATKATATTLKMAKLSKPSTANLVGSTSSSSTSTVMATGSTLVSVSMKKLNETVTTSSTTADLITASLDDNNRILRELEQQEANLLANRRKRLPGLESSIVEHQHSSTSISHQNSDTVTRASLRRQITLDDDTDVTSSPKYLSGPYDGKGHRQLLPSFESKQSKSLDFVQSDIINSNGFDERTFDEEDNDDEKKRREEGLREVKRLLRRNLGKDKLLLGASAVQTTGSLDDLMAKLERDNKVLAELDKNIYDRAIGHTGPTGLGGSLDFLSSQRLLQSSVGHHLPDGRFHLLQAPAMVAQSAPPLIFLPLNNLMSQSAAHHHLTGHGNLGDAGGGSLLHHQSAGRSTSRGESLFISETKDMVDSIEVPNRGRARVFIAKYSYDPFRQSPNENPESELSLAAGDFILIFGDIDSDGFYFGELLDGRRGLVPSNFVQQLTGEDLYEFQASVLYLPKEQQPPATGQIESANSSLKQRLAAADRADLQLQHQQKTTSARSTSAGAVGVTDLSDLEFPAEFYDAILDDAIGHTSFQHLLAPEDFHRMNDYVELADADNEQVMDEDDLYPDPERAQAVAARDPVPPPKRLVVERQLHKSVLLSWLHPDAPRGFIDCFHVYVDGVLKISVPASERTKALIEGVDSSMAHRISVRAVTPNGRQSRDAACTVVIGKNIPFAPCCVKATSITSESALISWLPCNSNFYHVVAVNSVEVKTVNPSTYKHLITGE